ncbi:RICIN domain-containing protein [Streptomyces sp. LP11]|uniref:RICIN domain-containing protein n=1 Tax=Streptomyces pyxinicus TaxID=2970331 RepID=A0ABT2B926_9ACTN|nr:RICIN domain-containing protein [Streptomyces sp. LP11]MCS0604413.1 RICIN domain-containing protein [Streptomyces sp. LP11]
MSTESVPPPQGRRTPHPVLTATRRLIVLLAVLTTALTTLIALPPGARANDQDKYQLTTWNMQRGSNRWAQVFTLARGANIVALQEVPNVPPAGAQPTGEVDHDTNTTEYLWLEGGSDARYLYLMRGAENQGGGLNLAFVTDFPVNMRTELVRVPGVHRDAMGIVRDADNILFANIHASANGGSDAASLVSRVRNAAIDLNVQNWAVLGDFNRVPHDLQATAGMPGGVHIYNAGQATHQGGNELDYLVTNVNTQEWRAAVQVNTLSDHWPVFFGGMRAAADPAELTMSPENSPGQVLDVEGAGRSNGTHVILFHPTAAGNQKWKLVQNGVNGLSKPLYRIKTEDSGKCLDVDWGQSSFQGAKFNVWDCHEANGSPSPGGPARDTQNFTLEVPDPFFPNEVMIRDNATGYYVNINQEQTGDNASVIQWPSQGGTPNEVFYLRPAAGTGSRPSAG